jgi:hypothetical protein
VIAIKRAGLLMGDFRTTSWVVPNLRVEEEKSRYVVGKLLKKQLFVHFWDIAKNFWKENKYMKRERKKGKLLNSPLGRQLPVVLIRYPDHTFHNFCLNTYLASSSALTSPAANQTKPNSLNLIPILTCGVDLVICYQKVLVYWFW